MSLSIYRGTMRPGRCQCSVRGTSNFPTYHQCTTAAVTMAPWGPDASDIPVCHRHSVASSEARRLRGAKSQERSRQY